MNLRTPLDRRDFIRLAGATAGAAALPLAVPRAASAAPAAALAPTAVAAGHRARGNLYAAQQAMVDRRFGMFIHFNMATYHDMEWVDPGQDPASFNPTALDCGQWADAAAAAGMTFAVLTVKHHDGFCLWPTRFTDYGVMSSSYRHDVVRQFVTAFRARGITPCLYFSIWDRTQGVAAGSVTPDAMRFVKGQLTELLTGYGHIPLLITDGWSWSMGHQHAPVGVPYGEIRNHIRALQPDTLFLDLNGLSEPWESDLLFYEEPKPDQFAPAGNTYAATQGQTISPAQGWFWHPATPTAGLLSAADIAEGHLRPLEQRWTTFILNCPPNPQGLLDDNIVGTLRAVGSMWRPDRSRPALPAQPDALLHAVTPVAAAATSGDATLLIDGHNDWAWSGNADQTMWASTAALPQSVTLDLGAAHEVDTLTYLPRQELDAARQHVTDGNITAYRVCVSTDGRHFHPAATGRWAADKRVKQARFRGTARARFVRLEALAAQGGFAAASELGVGRVGAVR